MSSTRRVTIREIAEMSQVSVSTVSNVLNGRTTAMSAETLQRVRRVVAEVRYRPSSVARGLVTGRTSTIGLVLAEIETSLFFSAIGSVEHLAREAGYNVIVCHARGARDEREVVSLLRAKGVDGIVFVSNSEKDDDSHLLALPAAGIQAVVINRPRPGREIGRVTWDDRKSVAAAVEHLHALGHRRIAHLRGPHSRQSAKARLSGYRMGLRSCGLPFRSEYVRLGDYNDDPAGWAASTCELLALDPAPTAVIGADDSVAAVAMRTVQQAGLRVPDDFAVVGVDDQMFAPLLNPALTTIRLPIREAAEGAFTMLLGNLTEEAGGMRDLRLPAQLVVRESCGGAERTARN